MEDLGRKEKIIQCSIIVLKKKKKKKQSECRIVTLEEKIEYFFSRWSPSEIVDFVS
jgi:hypothetical protein